MYSRNDIRDLRELTSAVLELAEKSLRDLQDGRISRRDFDEISISLASRLNYTGSIYADLADMLGTAGFEDRAQQSSRLVSDAMKDFIIG